MAYPIVRWDADGVDGRPSSMDVLLEWLARPGNAQRWLTSAGMGIGSSREDLVSEVHDMLLSHGITHRSRQNIRAKLRYCEGQLDKANKWLRDEGVHNFQVDKETERKVLELCPHYRELTPLLRPSSAFAHRLNGAGIEISRTAGYECSGDEVEAFRGSSGVRRAASTEPKSYKKARPQRVEYAYNQASSVKWGSDAADGRPSSLDVLLEWLVAPGNAERWCAAVRTRDRSRLVLAGEVYDLLLIHGITHRSPIGVVSKLRLLEEQFDKAERWLKRTGTQQFDDSAESEEIVLHMCPEYPKIASVLRSARRSVATSSSRPSRSEPEGVRYRQVTEKSVAPRTKRNLPKHAPSSPQCTDAVDAEGVVLLKAEPEERREFFKLELQVKRDQAVCVRAKARKDLFDMGMSPEDVDRLLPL